MTLNQEGVEKAAAVARRERDLGCNPCSVSTIEDVLTAYFDHLREAGLLREAEGLDYNTQWNAVAPPPAMRCSFPCHILRTAKE